jgi:hypothetical protein
MSIDLMAAHLLNIERVICPRRELLFMTSMHLPTKTSAVCRTPLHTPDNVETELERVGRASVVPHTLASLPVVSARTWLRS